MPRFLLLARDDNSASPVVRLNRAVALSRVAGADAALQELDRVGRHPAMARYPLLPVVQALFQSEAGRRDAAARSLRRAIGLARTAPERRLLEERLAALSREAAR